MQIALPEMNVAATLILDSENPRNEEQFVAFCEANRDLKIERTPRGNIIGSSGKSVGGFRPR